MQVKLDNGPEIEVGWTQVREALSTCDLTDAEISDALSDESSSDEEEEESTKSRRIEQSCDHWIRAEVAVSHREA